MPSLARDHQDSQVLLYHSSVSLIVGSRARARPGGGGGGGGGWGGGMGGDHVLIHCLAADIGIWTRQRHAQLMHMHAQQVKGIDIDAKLMAFNICTGQCPWEELPPNGLQRSYMPIVKRH